MTPPALSSRIVVQGYYTLQSWNTKDTYRQETTMASEWPLAHISTRCSIQLPVREDHHVLGPSVSQRARHNKHRKLAIYDGFEGSRIELSANW
jgi:hypothetical protein